jgi:hypothetical protein
MSWRFADPATARRHSLLATLAVVLLLAPSLAALEHPAHETPEAGLVHVEATHPQAAPHLEQEEHSALENCPVCLQAGRAAMDLDSHSWQLTVIESPRVVVVPAWVEGCGVGPAQPRGPPA